MRKQATALAAVVAASLALATCSKAPAGPGGGGGGGGGQTTATVSIPLTDYGGNQQPAYSPTVVVIPAGGAVTWKNNDTVAHTTTSDTGIWNAPLAAGDSYTRTFAAAGTFTFACSIHAAMTGRVVVQ